MPLALSAGSSVNVLPSIITDSNKSEFDALAVKLTLSPSASLASKVTIIFSPSSNAESGVSIYDKIGTSFTFSIVTSKEIDSDERPPSFAEIVIDPVPTWFSPGLTVNVEPETLTSNKSLDVLALNVKSMSPSISVALRATFTDDSSSVFTPDIATIEGASFTGVIVKLKLSEVWYSPSTSLTLTVIIPSPL